MKNKMTAVDAAARVLGAAGKPMSSWCLYEAMRKKKLWVSPKGKTPWDMIYTAVKRDVRFQKVGPDLWALASWTSKTAIEMIGELKDRIRALDRLANEIELALRGEQDLSHQKITQLVAILLYFELKDNRPMGCQEVSGGLHLVGWLSNSKTPADSVSARLSVNAIGENSVIEKMGPNLYRKRRNGNANQS